MIGIINTVWNVKGNKVELDLDHVVCCVSLARYTLKGFANPLIKSVTVAVKPSQYKLE